MNFHLTQSNMVTRRAVRLTKLVNMKAPSIIIAKELSFLVETVARISQDLSEHQMVQEELEGLLGDKAIERAKKARTEWEELDDEGKKGRLSASVHFLKESAEDIEEIVKENYKEVDPS